MSFEHSHACAPDPAETEYFLESFFGLGWSAVPLVTQTFDDNTDRKKGNGTRDPLAKIRGGTWEECRMFLTTMNRNGAGVFFTVNETEGGRQIEHLRNVRAVWCEWDRPEPMPEWELAPHIVVESSPHKYHVYWLVRDMTPVEHTRTMETIVGQWGGDPNAKDLVRVLRLPGFYHQKVNREKQLFGEPFLVHVLKAESREALPPYTTDDIFTGFRVHEWEAKQGSTRKGPGAENKSSRRAFVTQINITELKDALKMLSADTRAVWLRIGMSLASTNHAAAFALWDEWSRTSAKYDEEDQYRTWQSFREQGGKEHPNPITLGTLYKMSKDAGWDREAGWQRGLLTNQQGHPIACPANIALILRFTPIWRGLLKYDQFGGYVEYGPCQYDAFGRSEGAHRWTDTDDGKLADYLRAEYHMPVSHLTHCTQAVENVAHDDEYDPIVSWLEELPEWDQVDRLGSFFEDFCQVEKSPYAAFCGTSLFLSLVARAYSPGCQVDTVLVLQGPEGARKTSLCRLLGGPWYKAITLSFESKDLFTSLRRTWLGELAELDSFARSGQARIKALITTMDDTYRPPYARNEINQPRRSVFIGTTNDPAYLVDPHGARRFFPLKVGYINIEGICGVLAQLFAEARDRYKAGETWWDTPPDVAAIAEERRDIAREADPWEAPIGDWVTKHSGEILMTDIMGSLCLNIPDERRTRAFMTRIGTILHGLGYEKQQRRSSADWRQREYYYTKINPVGA